MNKAIKINEVPLNAVWPSSVLNSSWSLLEIDEIKVSIPEEVNQNLGVKIIINKAILIQFKGRWKFAEGSKTEKRLVIIFKLV